MNFEYVLILLLATVAVAYPTAPVPVEWANVPSTTPTARNLNSPYLGECVCDATWGVCDPYCCCDDDCNAATISSFSYCLPETFSAPYLDYCYPKDRATALHRINNIDATYIDKKMQGYNAVCVIRANHPSELYKYFRVPTSVQQPKIPTSTAKVVAANESYNIGDFLVFAKLTEIDNAATYRRVDVVELPTTAGDGSCSAPGRSISFLEPIRGVSCTLNGAQICSRFPTSLYTNLLVQKILWHSGDATDFVPVTLHIKNTSGSILDTIDPDEVPASSNYLSYADGQICRHAVVALRAQFTYASNSTGTIANATFNVTVADVELNRFAALNFEAGFVAVNVTIPDNVIAGTPGYLPGYKVRAGTLVSSDGKSAILERASGFAVPAGGRICHGSLWKRSNFLYSVFNSGCVVSMSQSQLQSVCSTGTGDLIRDLVNSTVDGQGVIIDRIAMTNDALTNDTTSWISIDGLSDAFTSRSGTYDAYNRVCTNVMVGLHYQFVIARAGAEYNPQDVIVGAFASPISGRLRIRNQSSFGSGATSLQRIAFKVSFSRYDPDSQATIIRRVIAPPILPRLDDTIFYPFRRPYPL